LETFFFEYGYWGLFAASFLAATVLPFSSEALLSLMLVAGFDFYTVVLVAALGNFLGGMSSYYLGYWAKWTWLERYFKIKKSSILKTERWVNKYGSFLAFWCWLPAVGDLLAVALGIFRSNYIAVAVFMLAGKLFRYYLWALFTLELTELF